MMETIPRFGLCVLCSSENLCQALILRVKGYSTSKIELEASETITQVIVVRILLNSEVERKA